MVPGGLRFRHSWKSNTHGDTWRIIENVQCASPQDNVPAQSHWDCRILPLWSSSALCMGRWYYFVQGCGTCPASCLSGLEAKTLKTHINHIRPPPPNIVKVELCLRQCCLYTGAGFLWSTRLICGKKYKEKSGWVGTNLFRVTSF